MAGIEGDRTTTGLWRGTDTLSAEYCRFESTSDGHRLSGLVILPVEGRPG